MYQKHNKSIGIVQWRMDDEELEDIYYMSIRLGVENAPPNWVVIC